MGISTIIPVDPAIIIITLALAKIYHKVLKLQGISSYRVPIYYTWVESGKHRLTSC